MLPHAVRKRLLKVTHHKAYSSPVDYKSNFKPTPLHLAAKLAIVKQLVKEYKTDLNSCDEEHATPLFKAATGGHSGIVRKLIVEFDCSIKPKGFEGRSLLHHACQSGNIELSIMLIEEFNYACHSGKLFCFP